jgi:hypothetical protein
VLLEQSQRIVTVWLYEEKVPEFSGIPEIPLDPPFSKGEILSYIEINSKRISSL